MNLGLFFVLLKARHLWFVSFCPLAVRLEKSSEKCSMLFLIYINDLPAVTKRKSYLIADDTTLLLSHYDAIQNFIRYKIRIWMNPSKFILFSKNSPLTFAFNLSCGGLTIEQVERTVLDTSVL